MCWIFPQIAMSQCSFYWIIPCLTEYHLCLRIWFHSIFLKSQQISVCTYEFIQHYKMPPNPKREVNNIILLRCYTISKRKLLCFFKSRSHIGLNKLESENYFKETKGLIPGLVCGVVPLLFLEWATYLHAQLFPTDTNKVKDQILTKNKTYTT